MVSRVFPFLAVMCLCRVPTLSAQTFEVGAQPVRAPSSDYQIQTFAPRPLSPEAPENWGAITVLSHSSMTPEMYEVLDTAPQPGDGRAPAIAIRCNGGACASGWYRGPVTVSLAASDDVGIAQVRYTIDGSDPASYGVAYTGPFAIVASANVRVFAVDTSSNTAFQAAPLLVAPGAMPPTYGE